jgi:hypothetical protein
VGVVDREVDDQFDLGIGKQRVEARAPGSVLGRERGARSVDVNGSQLQLVVVSDALRVRPAILPQRRSPPGADEEVM